MKTNDDIKRNRAKESVVDGKMAFKYGGTREKIGAGLNFFFFFLLRLFSSLPLSLCLFSGEAGKIKRMGYLRPEKLSARIRFNKEEKIYVRLSLLKSC